MKNFMKGSMVALLLAGQSAAFAQSFSDIAVEASGMNSYVDPDENAYFDQHKTFTRKEALSSASLLGGGIITGSSTVLVRKNLAKKLQEKATYHPTAESVSRFAKKGDELKLYRAGHSEYANIEMKYSTKENLEKAIAQASKNGHKGIAEIRVRSGSKLRHMERLGIIGAGLTAIQLCAFVVDWTSYNGLIRDISDIMGYESEKRLK